MCRPINKTPLSERVCRSGHAGYYIARGKNAPACSKCLSIQQANFRLRRGMKPATPRLKLWQLPEAELVERREKLTEQLAEVMVALVNREELERLGKL